MFSKEIKRHDPYEKWGRMDNYLSHFLFEHPDLDPVVKSRIKHFQVQYLAKISNISYEDAVFFEQNISPWNTSGRGDYHRFYHINPLLNEIEADLALSMGVERSRLVLLSNRESFERALGSFSVAGSFAKVEGQDLFCSEGERESIHPFIVERGLTPTLQQAAGVAARISLCQPNPTHEFPQQNPPESSFSHFIRHPVIAELKRVSFLGTVLAELLEGFEDLGLDASFEKRGVESLLGDSYGRILWFIEQALKVDLSVYGNGPKFESYLDLVYEEMILWLMILEPYSDLEALIRKAIAPPSWIGATSTGMAAFSEVLNRVLEKDRTILLYDGIYFENRAALLKSYPSEAFYLVRSPDYRASLKGNLELLRERKKTVDLLFVNFHENILKGRYVSRENDISSILDEVFEAGCASSSLTVVIDTTIGFLDSEEIRDLLKRFDAKIQSKALHVIVLWSHQKFDLFGVDKFSGGSYCIYSEDAALVERFKEIRSDEIDFVSRQGLSHFFAVGWKRMEERREKIFSNALYVNQRILDNLKQGPPIQVVLKQDPLNFSVDVQCGSDLETDVCRAFIKRGVPLITRSGFGYNLTTVAFTQFNMIRFSIGIEDRKFLDQFVSAFNEIFSELITS